MARRSASRTASYSRVSRSGSRDALMEPGLYPPRPAVHKTVPQSLWTKAPGVRSGLLPARETTRSNPWGLRLCSAPEAVHFQRGGWPTRSVAGFRGGVSPSTQVVEVSPTFARRRARSFRTVVSSRSLNPALSFSSNATTSRKSAENCRSPAGVRVTSCERRSPGRAFASHVAVVLHALEMVCERRALDADGVGDVALHRVIALLQRGQHEPLRQRPTRRHERVVERAADEAARAGHVETDGGLGAHEHTIGQLH